MKKLLLWVAFLAFCPLIWAQNLQILQNSYQKVAFSLENGSLSVDAISIAEGDFSLLSLPGCFPSNNPGAPQLPVWSKLLQVPVCDSVVAHVTGAQYTDYDAADLGIIHPVFPAQFPASKGGDVPPFAYNSTVYATNAFYSLPLVRVEKAGIKRSAALANIYVSPVQYNPVTGKVRIYTQLDVEVTFVNADMARTNALKKFGSPMFSLDESLVINKMQEDRDELSTLPIKYLIIGNSMFANNEYLETFVSWKRRLGYIVEVAFTNEAAVGTTTTSIKNYIQSRYDAGTATDPAPTFLLLLGDREQLPAFTGTTDNDHITDLYYATLSGNDNLPDLYYGRLSATNNDQLSHQFEKILEYEQYSMPDPSYLGKAVLIAGTDANFGPTHANGQVNYITSNYMNASNPRYTNVMAHLYNCSSEAAQIRAEVSAGAGWVNYTAHGSETSWADPSFTTSHVAQLQNTDKYGLMIGNCCQSGNFKTGECFGEALLRADKKGAMGYIGASNNSYWGEDFYWAVGVRSGITANPVYDANALGMYDKVFHAYGEDYSNWVSTIGGILTGGNMTVESSTSSLKLYYWEIYHCFGDPSVRVFLGIPSTMDVVASPVIPTNTTTYNVTVAPYSYVALTCGTTLIGAVFADENGAATIQLPQSLDPCTCELVVLAQNYIPYFQTVQVITPNGPYVIPVSVEVADNTIYTQGSHVNMNISLSNVGVSAASQVYATLTPDIAITMLQDSVYVGGISVNGTESRVNAFSFVMPEAEDYVQLPFTLRVHWQDTIIVRSVNVRVELPKVQLKEYTATVNSAPVQTYLAGDEVVFSFQNQNAGHVAVNHGSVDLTCNYSGVQVVTNSLNINGLNPNDIVVRDFTVRIADTVPAKSLVPLYYHIAYDGMSRVDTLQIMVGADMVDFESGDFGPYTWNMNSYPWIVTNTNPHSGNYCVRSSQNLPSNANSRMTITVSPNMDAYLSYYRKVSSEANYDKFILYVDGNQVDVASGEVPWSQYTTEIPAGTHTIRFSYEKDYSQANGSDCAWIDDIMLPCVGIMVIEDVTDPTDVSVEEYAKAHATVFPNPTSDRVIIESENAVQKVVLFDLNGRIVKTEILGGENRCEMLMGDVPAGFYLLQLTFDDQQIQNLKIIKR